MTAAIEAALEGSMAARGKRREEVEVGQSHAVDLTKEERAQKGEELAAKQVQLQKQREKAKDTRARLREAEAELKEEIEILAEEVTTGKKYVPAQGDLDLGES